MTYQSMVAIGTHDQVARWSRWVEQPTLLLPGWLKPRDDEVQEAMRSMVPPMRANVQYATYEQPIEIWPETLERCARLAAEL